MQLKIIIRENNYQFHYFYHFYKFSEKFRQSMQSPSAVLHRNRLKNIKKKAEINKKLQESLLQRFQKFNLTQKQNHLSQKLLKFYGRDYAINYKPQYKFTEQWQGNTSSQNIESNSLLEQSGVIYFLYSFFFMILNIFGIWTITIERYFQTDIISKIFFIHQILLFFTLIDITSKTILNYNYSQQKGRDILEIIKTNTKNIFCCLYYLIMMIDNVNSIFMQLFELYIIFIIYRKSANTYHYMKVMEFGLKYQNQVKIMDLLCNIMIQAHVFAIVLYSSTKINQNQSWVNQIPINNANPLQKYVWSFYFASTTMLTIGYGDITPKNTGQVIVTVLIQIIGVISFGYLLNEMGHTLSKMRKQSQILEKDLQTIRKISKYYNLNKNLQNKAKNFIFTNQTKPQQLKIEDENMLLMKLNEDLRQEINLENSLTVVKSCIFYLCHWSKRMQTEIARRLQKRLFSPNEKLVSTSGTERVYIIKKGNVNIFMNKYGTNQEYRKLLKVIDTRKLQEVSNNIYGYTTAFSNRPVNLEAIANDFTSTYSVSKEEFLECIYQNTQDFQYYHEIKCRIDQSTFCQEYETPSIKNIRSHYSPSKIILIKKYRNLLQKSINKRQDWARRRNMRFKLLSNYVNKNIFEDYSNQYENDSLTEKTIQFTRIKKNHQFLAKRMESRKDENSLQLSEQIEEDSFKLSMTLAVLARMSKQISKAEEQNENKQKISPDFEIYKEYQNFFKNNNISNVLWRYQSENCIDNQLHQIMKTSTNIKQLI